MLKMVKIILWKEYLKQKIRKIEEIDLVKENGLKEEENGLKEKEKGQKLKDARIENPNTKK